MAEPTQNGFFKGTGSFEEVNVGKFAGDQNPPFLWPSNQYQVYNGRELVGKTLVRGYIRSLLGDANSIFNITVGVGGQGGNSSRDSTNSRLNFQFNPELIVRDVARSDGAINPLLTDPINLTQPVPGTATFSFSMTFNREAEVAMGASIRASDPVVAVNATNAAHLQGVMADIKVLDSIIGQGIDKKTIDTLIKYSNQAITVEANAINAANTANAATAGYVPVVAPDVLNAATIRTNLANNEGNQAFLNPMPVRIVFSEFLMVEGFVTSTAVAFQKFSPEMIPTIAQVNCVVQALYFGFAKEKAFLSDNLKQLGGAIPGNNAPPKVVLNAKVTAALNSLFPIQAIIRPNYYVSDMTSSDFAKAKANIENNEDYWNGEKNKTSWRAPTSLIADKLARIAQGAQASDTIEYPSSNLDTIGFHQAYNLLNNTNYWGVDDHEVVPIATGINFFNPSGATPATNGKMPCLIEFIKISKSKVDNNLNQTKEVFFDVKVTLAVKTSKGLINTAIPMSDPGDNIYSNLIEEKAGEYKAFTQCFLNFKGLISSLKTHFPTYNPQQHTAVDRNYAVNTDTFILTFTVRPWTMINGGRVEGSPKKATATFTWDSPLLFRNPTGIGIGVGAVEKAVMFT